MTKHDKTCSLSAWFCKLAFHPSGILDKACSLLACFWKTALHQAYLTKHVLFQLAFAKRHLTRPTWQTCSLLQTGILSGMLDKACCLSAYLAKRHFTRHTWQSMFSFYISPGRLDKACSLSACFCTTAFHQAYLTKFDKACSLSACFCKTAFHQAYLTKHVLFQLVFAKRHFARHTWQSMFSFSLFWQNGTSPGILDKDDKACSLLACFWKRHFPRHTWPSMFSFSLLLQKDIWLGLLDKHVLFCKLAFYPVCLTKHVVFQLILQNGISPGILDKACSLFIFHQADLTKHVLSRLVFAQRHFTRHTWQSIPDRMPVWKREHVCQVGLVKCLFAKASWKRTCFVKYAWWNAVVPKQGEREHAWNLKKA